MKYAFLPVIMFLVVIASCNKETSNVSSTNIIFKFKFDTTQSRLNNIGQPSIIPTGNAALSPSFNGMSAHYLELAPDALTALGTGAILYRADETTVGGTNAIDFEKCSIAKDGATFLSLPIKNIKAGEYEWIRLSLAYQNYDIRFRIDTTIAGVPIHDDFNGTVASFIGFNSFIKSYTVKTDTIMVNGNRKQGYWGLETNGTVGGMPVKFKQSGQAPEGATTVVNPIFATSPIPAGSCVVTAAFKPGKLVITGKETQDIVVEISLSTNKSFEWKEVIHNGKWDPLKGEKVVDMGIRGMIPTIK
ncbi:hypothetical protein BH10BAC3_BH10BAC3_29570 [soil metagenome]